MCTDGVTPSTELGMNILDHKQISEKDLSAPPKLDNETSESKEDDDKKGECSPQVTFAEHPEYGKYFRMLKAGIPGAAVKTKMTQEGLNPDFLDRNPNDIVPDLPKKKESDEKSI